MIISKELEEYLSKNCCEVVDIIQYNNRKYTYILKISKDKKIYVIKGFNLETPSEIKQKFYNEIKFYKENRLEFLPKLIDTNEFFMVIEFIDGITLREYMKLKNVDDTIIYNLSTQLSKLYSLTHKKIESDMEIDFSNAFSHLSALLQSGPFQTKEMKISKFVKIRNKILSFILKNYLKFLISKLDQSKLKIGLMHGDLHYNNILITNDNNIIFIDFENIQYNGFFDFDQLYLYAIIEKALSNNYNFIDNKELVKIFNLYKYAISLNKRF